LLHFGLEQASPPESLVPGASKESAVSVHPNVSASLCGTGGSMYDFWSITFLGAATGLRLVSALGCHLHERGRGWPPFRFRGADDLQPIQVTCMSRGNEARIWSGHHLQNDLCLARLRSAPRPCTLRSPRRWTYVPEPLGHLLWHGYKTAPRFRTAWLTPSRERSRRSPYQ